MIYRMKGEKEMIDKKGRIFGKINVIDLLVIVLVVCMLGGVGYKIFGPDTNKTMEQKEERGMVYATFKVTCVVAESANYVKVGEHLVIADKLTDVEIVNVSFEDTKEVGFTDGGELTVENNPLYVDGYIKVKAEGIKTGEGIKMQGVYIRVNDTFDLITERFSAGSKVVDIQFETEE